MVPPAGSPSPPPNPQYTQQFLSSVLSQCGPPALPYSEDVKWLIRQHLLSINDNYPSLQPKTVTFTLNDGRTINLLQADGTVPMIFQDVTYNIPIVIWLMESYPRQAPLVFVNPTRDMIIKRPHSFVNPSGMVSIPYLQNWIYPSSNLVDLSRNLSQFFGHDPPLYSQRRPNPNPNPSPNPYPHPSFVPLNHGVISSNSSSVGSARPAIPPRTYPPSPYGSGRIQVQPQAARTEDPTEVFKRNTINKLVESVHSDIGAMRKNREAEMEGLFNAQAVLRQREELISKGVREMQNEKEGLEQQLQMILTNSDVLEGWLRDNEGKMANTGNVDIDETFDHCDALSKQMLDSTASDFAIEDVIYALDKAAQEGSIPLDQYLRNVRLLSREQFFHRATSSKVRAAQMQSQYLLSEKRWLAACSSSSSAKVVAQPLGGGGNEGRSIPTREPVIMMQHPQSINIKQNPVMNISVSPPGTNRFYTKKVATLENLELNSQLSQNYQSMGIYGGYGAENFTSQHLYPQSLANRIIGPENLNAPPYYQQTQYAQHRSHASGSVDSALAWLRSTWAATGASSPSVNSPSSLGLFSGWGLTLDHAD